MSPRTGSDAGGSEPAPTGRSKPEPTGRTAVASSPSKLAIPPAPTPNRAAPTSTSSAAARRLRVNGTMPSQDAPPKRRLRAGWAFP
jgi:hypothetical protein